MVLKPTELSKGFHENVGLYEPRVGFSYDLAARPQNGATRSVACFTHAIVANRPGRRRSADRAVQPDIFYRTMDNMMQSRAVPVKRDRCTRESKTPVIYSFSAAPSARDRRNTSRRRLVGSRGRHLIQAPRQHDPRRAFDPHRRPDAHGQSAAGQFLRPTGMGNDQRLRKHAFRITTAALQATVERTASSSARVPPVRSAISRRVRGGSLPVTGRARVEFGFSFDATHVFVFNNGDLPK